MALSVKSFLGMRPFQTGKKNYFRDSSSNVHGIALWHVDHVYECLPFALSPALSLRFPYFSFVAFIYASNSNSCRCSSLFVYSHDWFQNSLARVPCSLFTVRWALLWYTQVYIHKIQIYRMTQLQRLKTTTKNISKDKYQK